MLETEKAFGILSFADGWNRKQRSILDAIILKHNLQVFSYPAKSYLLIGEGSDLSLISSYAVGAVESVPIIRDIVEGGTCAFDLRLDIAKMPCALVEFETHVWGTRFEDMHYSLRSLLKKDSWQIGGKAFVAPLAKWTRAEVIEALKIYGIDYIQPSESEDTGNIAACSKCLTSEKEVLCPKTGETIPAVVWDRKKNLELFRESLGEYEN